MSQQELIQIETASMATNNGLEYMFQVVINQQDTPAISLDGLRELRRLCDCFIHLGEENEKTKALPHISRPTKDAPTTDF
jgi:hypothetical protein